jgi:hypothetical protein
MAGVVAVGFPKLSHTRNAGCVKMKIFIIPTEWHDGQDNIQQVQCERARYQDGSGMIACRRKMRPKLKEFCS